MAERWIIFDGRDFVEGAGEIPPTIPAEDRWPRSPLARDPRVVLGEDEGALAAVPALLERGPTSLLVWQSSRFDARALHSLAGLPLRELMLVGCPSLAGGLETLAHWPLERLALADCRGLGARALRSLRELTRLTFLDLRGGVASRGLLRWLTPLRALRWLDLSRAERGDDLGTELRAIGTLPRLEYLALRGSHVDRRLCAQLGAFPALETLDLSEARIDTMAKADWRRLRQLRRLIARGLGENEWRQLAPLLPELEGLAALDLTGTVLEPRTYDALRAALPETVVLTASRACEPAPRPVRTAARSGTEAPAAVAVELPPARAPGTRRFADDPLTVEKLYVVMPDERGNPCGIDLRHDVAVWVERYDPASIVEVVRSSATSLDVLVGALEALPPAMASVHGEAVLDEAVAAAAAWIDDDRVFEWRERGWQHGVFQVDRLAAQACLALVERRRLRCLARRTSPARPEDAVLLERIVLRGIARPVVGIARVLERLGSGAAAWPDLPPETAVGWVEQAITDEARPARLRVEAFEQLERFHAYRAPGPLRERVRGVLDRGLACFASALREPGSDAWLRQRAGALLATRAPGMLARLLEEGALDEWPLPAFAELASEARVLDVVPHIRGETVARALAGEDLDGLLTAATLAPFVGDESVALRNAGRLAELIGRAEQLDLESGGWSPRLGELAGRQLATLAGARLGDAALPAVERAIEKGLAGPVGWQLTTPPGLSYAIGTFAERRGASVAKARWREGFADRTRPAEARFALYLAAGLGVELGAAPVVDETEDPDVRALIGTLGAGYWADSLLAACADTGTSPWTAKRVVPVVEPADRVPLSWIEETLRLARHPIPRGRALDALVDRLLPVEGDPGALAAGVRALRAREAPADLRAFATSALAERPDGLPRGRMGAARWLAALGDPRDEACLAEHVAHREAWYGTREQPPPATDLERLLRALADGFVVDGAESALDPLLRLGFGDEGARRILAGAFVVLAGDHLAAGREDFARRSAIHAAELDPLSLAAKRLLRRWK